MNGNTAVLKINKLGDSERALRCWPSRSSWNRSPYASSPISPHTDEGKSHSVPGMQNFSLFSHSVGARGVGGGRIQIRQEISIMCSVKTATCKVLQRKSRVRRAGGAGAGSGSRQGDWKGTGATWVGTAFLNRADRLSHRGNFEQSPDGSGGWAPWRHGGLVFQAEGTAVHGQWSAEETGRRSGWAEWARGKGVSTGATWADMSSFCKDPSGSMWRKHCGGKERWGDQWGD